MFHENDTTSLLPNDTLELNTSLYYIQQSPDARYADCAPNILHSQIKDYLSIEWLLNGVTSLTVALFGLSGNLITILVLCQKKMRNAFNQLLIVMAIVDSLFLSCNTFGSILALKYDPDWLIKVQPIADAIGQVSMSASIFMLVALTWERHFAICSPHSYRIQIRTMPRWKHLAIYVVPVSFLSILFNIPAFLNLEPSRMNDMKYLQVNLYLRMLHPLTTTGLAPLALLTVLNVRICNGILRLRQRKQEANTGPRTTAKELASRKSFHPRNRHEIHMTYIAIMIVVIFVLLNMPRVVLGFFEVSDTLTILKCFKANQTYMKGVNYYVADMVARLLMVLNSSINFMVYCGASKKFQEAFSELFSCKRAAAINQPMSHGGSFNNNQIEMEAMEAQGQLQDKSS